MIVSQFVSVLVCLVIICACASLPPLLSLSLSLSLHCGYIFKAKTRKIMFRNNDHRTTLPVFLHIVVITTTTTTTVPSLQSCPNRWSSFPFEYIDNWGSWKLRQTGNTLSLSSPTTYISIFFCTSFMFDIFRWGTLKLVCVYFLKQRTKT